MFKTTKLVLGFLWALPISLIGWILGGLLYVSGQLEKVKVGPDLTFIWDYKTEGWFFKKFFKAKGWAGNSIGNNIFVGDTTGPRWERTLLHEGQHCRQCFSLGIFFPVVYILESLRIYMFWKDIHSYYDNCFEREARKCAGQPVEISRDLWKDGPTDRWAWW